MDRRRALLLMTLGMAFTGQILRWDQTCWGSSARRSPAASHWWACSSSDPPQWPIAGDADTLFALHVFVIPALIGLVGVHLLMVINPASEWPMPGRIVRRPIEGVSDLVQKDGLPFQPVAFQKDGLRLIMLALIGCSLWYGPFANGRPIPRLSRRCRGRTFLP